jgi:hypothetical protein
MNGDKHAAAVREAYWRGEAQARSRRIVELEHQVANLQAALRESDAENLRLHGELLGACNRCEPSGIEVTP